MGLLVATFLGLKWSLDYFIYVTNLTNIVSALILYYGKNPFSTPHKSDFSVLYQSFYLILNLDGALLTLREALDINNIKL